MRVISGSAKGRKLKFPRLSNEKKVRPLSDQAKEALFNILGSAIVDSYFLDLFAGTGAVGIEALSRGAKIAFFVEFDRKVVATIRENLEITGFSERAEVYSLDVRRAIKLLSSKGAQFNFIYLGAPYGSPVLEEVLGVLGGGQLVFDGGLIIAEHRNKQVVKETYDKLSKFEERRYGDTVFSFYKRGEN